jgi:ornithine decarboxylase
MTSLAFAAAPAPEMASFCKEPTPFAAKFGTSVASAALARVNAVPIAAGPDAIDEYARAVIADAGADAPEHFYVFDLGAVLERWRVWTTSLPRVTPYYAVKCNPDKAMLALLASMGTGFDCASPAEMELVRALGVGPDRIIYAHCCKMAKDIAYSASVGIQLTTFDTEAELVKVAQHHPGVGLVLRIRADDVAARCNLGDKYGAEEDEVQPLLAAAKALGLTVVGISFHVGSGARNPAAFPTAVGKAREAFDLALSMGFPMSLLDLGGGYSGNLTEGITMQKVASSLNAALEAFFPAAQGVRVIAEPGRYFAEPGMTLHTRVFGKRVRDRVNADSRYYWVADGVYGSMNCQIYDHAELTVRPFSLTAPTPAEAAIDACMSGNDESDTMSDGEGAQHALSGEEPLSGELNAPPSPARSEEAKPLLASTIYGPTCDGMDTLLRGVQLPELAVGDWLQWPSMGAYTLAAGSAFNGFDSQAVAVHYVMSSA